ncbi:MAG: ABC transporter substrate-binding protein [Pseudomonadota bacterium]
MRRRAFLSGGAVLAIASALPLGVLANDIAAAKRIVVAGGDLTEIVFALGQGDRVVGVDQTSQFPPEVADLAQIGYVRRLSAEGVLSLAPDLVIAADDAGPDVVMEQLQAAGVPIARAPETKTAAEIANKIAFVGEVLGQKDQAAAEADAFSARLAEITEKTGTLPSQPRVLFVLSVRSGAPLVGGLDTAAHEMITLAGGENVAADINGYKPMGREAILAAAPDVVLMMEQHAARQGGIDAILARPEIALTPAGQAKRAVTMDGMLLLGFGPRTPEAIAQLARALHPDTAAAAGL